jgi:hypothetical protein
MSVLCMVTSFDWYVVHGCAMPGQPLFERHECTSSLCLVEWCVVCVHEFAVHCPVLEKYVVYEGLCMPACLCIVYECALLGVALSKFAVHCLL